MKNWNFQNEKKNVSADREVRGLKFRKSSFQEMCPLSVNPFLASLPVNNFFFLEFSEFSAIYSFHNFPICVFLIGLAAI